MVSHAMISSRRSTAAWLVAVGTPVLIAAVAYGLWWVSDRAGYVGPFDRASFFWIFVFPVWLVGPVLGGWTWRGLTDRLAAAAAIAVFIVVAGVAAGLLWSAVAFPDCHPAHTPAEWVAPSLVVGALVGGGIVASGGAACWGFRARRVVLGVAAGVMSEAVLSFVSIVVVGVGFLAGPGCQRVPAP